MIFNDLLKAFDTIDHQILIKKMKYLHYLTKIIETKVFHENLPDNW